MHVNPWVTLFAIDLPAAVLLLVFRPGEFGVGHLFRPFELLRPFPSFSRFVCVFLIGVNTVAVSTAALIVNEPAKVTSSYEVLEPETWVGKELPILEYIDIGEQIKKGRWLILFYHYDCPDCRLAIYNYVRMAQNIELSEDTLRIALIEIPPFGKDISNVVAPCRVGHLAEIKDWFIATPAVISMHEGNITFAWSKTMPDLNTIRVSVLERR